MSREIRTQNQLTDTESYIQVRRKKSLVSKCYRKCNCKKFLLETFPIADWIQEYQFKRDLTGDIAAGLTGSVLQIPQGISYGYLANIPPVCGIYSAFFTSFVYVIFGSSRHLSIGTFSVICLMVGQTVASYSVLDENGIELEQHPDVTEGSFKNTEVLSMVTFTVSMYMLIMYIFRMGIITSILSQTLINAFTSACGIQLICSQLKDLFGLTLPRRSEEICRIGFTLYDICTNIKNINYIALAMSSIAMVILIIYNELIKEQLAKKCSFPFPIELFIIASGTAVSYFLELHQKYDIAIIGHVPTGLPTPMAPNFNIFKLIALDCLSIATVSYIVTISYGFIFARKGSYLINPNQEFLALGLMNLVGSFFMCIPVCASSSRTIVQYNVGMVSQMCSIVSTFILLFVLLFLGPVLEHAPKGILAAIIISSVYRLLIQIGEFKTFWLLSKLDALIWIVTFLSTLIIEIKYGLLMGITSAILVIFYHFCTPQSHLLGAISGTEIYIPTHHYEEVKEIDDIKIFHFEGGLNFSSKNSFKKHLFEKTQVNAKQIIIDRKKATRKLKPGQQLPPIVIPIRCVIIDFSAITHVDPAGVKTLKNIDRDYGEIGCPVLICCVSDTIFKKLENYDKVTKVTDPFIIFLSIHDAVMYARKYIVTTRKRK